MAAQLHGNTVTQLQTNLSNDNCVLQSNLTRTSETRLLLIRLLLIFDGIEGGDAHGFVRGLEAGNQTDAYGEDDGEDV